MNWWSIHILLFTESDKDDLLLHPVMKTFLNIKWSLYQKTFWVNLIIDIFYAILLTILGQYFLTLIYCQPCEISSDWFMEIENGLRNETIHCFGPFKFCNDTRLHSVQKCQELSNNCTDKERCALFYNKGDDWDVDNVWKSPSWRVEDISKFFKNVSAELESLRCHKKHLRYLLYVKKVLFSFL